MDRSGQVLNCRMVRPVSPVFNSTNNLNREIMKNLLFVVMLAVPFLVRAQSVEEEERGMVVKATTALNYIASVDDPFLGFGVGAEARLGYIFSVGGDITFGTNEFSRYTFVQPNIRLYPAKAFRGFFLQLGMTYGRLNAREDSILVGPPFDPFRGTVVSTFAVDGGLGFSTLVDNRWSIGFSLGLSLPFDTDLEVGLNSSFGVGFAF
jgi:hypothetical protein